MWKRGHWVRGWWERARGHKQPLLGIPRHALRQVHRALPPGSMLGVWGCREREGVPGRGAVAGHSPLTSTLDCGILLLQNFPNL